MLVDIHCHIYKEYYDDIDNILFKMKQNGVDKIINNGCDFNTSLEVLELSKNCDNMFCAIGIHPDEIGDSFDDFVNLFLSNLENKKLVAIGEIGLDYFHNKDNKNEQIKLLENQLSLAQKYDYPVIIHSRESTGDMISILKKYKVRGVIHCFNGSVETANEYIKMGYKLGINGVVTFKNCKLIDVIRQIGVNNLVFETDSPYLTPKPNRGKKNYPYYVKDVVKFVSDELNISYNELVKISNNNVKDIFDI